jgi:phosphoglycerate dehydrogenase-like enzyme
LCWRCRGGCRITWRRNGSGAGTSRPASIPIYLGEATALIVGVGGIGHETARLCTALGMTVLGVDPRPEYDVTGVEIHPVADLDTLLPRADFVIVTTPHTPETEGM